MNESSASSVSPGRGAGWVAKLLGDERGGESLEYALIIGLVLITAIAVVGSLGGKAMAR